MQINNIKEPFIHNKNGIDRNGCDVLKLINEAKSKEDFLEVINISSDYIEFYIEQMQYYRRLAAYREGVILALRKDE